MALWSFGNAFFPATAMASPVPNSNQQAFRTSVGDRDFDVLRYPLSTISGTSRGTRREGDPVGEENAKKQVLRVFSASSAVDGWARFRGTIRHPFGDLISDRKEK
jgi:hypothetical protein